MRTVSVIKEKFSGNIKIGDPCTSAIDMRELSESDAVVMVVPLKQESRKKVEQTEQICRGYNTDIVGVITI